MASTHNPVFKDIERDRKCLLVAYGYALNDPPSRQAATSLMQDGWNVTVFQSPPSGVYASPLPDGIQVYEPPDPLLPRSAGPLYRMLRWYVFRKSLRHWIGKNNPSLIVTIMLHPLAALPNKKNEVNFKLLSCIYDIPSLPDAGNLDAAILRRGWKRLGKADVIWSSDVFKAQLTQHYGALVRTPVVCHNCPPLNYLPEPAWPRDGWLRSELRRQGATIGENDGCILLRAGAVGEAGGIEAVIEALRELPDDFIFLAMGRPTGEYRDKLLGAISEMGLQRRAFLWERPSDEVWKQALLGADIGHLVHGPFAQGRETRQYDLNSSLSNNRLFQYMAAGLPIVSYDDPRMSLIHEEVNCFRVVRLGNLVEDTRRVLLELAVNSTLRESLGRSGRKAHLTTYCWERQFLNVTSLL